MKFTRRVRKKVTVDLLRLGERLARKGNVRSVEGLRRCLLWFTKIAIPLRRRLKQNIYHASIDPDGLIDAYFERAADQLIMLAHGFRADFDISFVLKSFRFDDSISHLEQAKAKGKGVMIIAPHLCSYPSVVCVISTRIPCAVYSRKNRDSRKVDLMDVLAKTGDVEVIYRPEDASRAQRLQVAVDVLRQGKMLFITPDTPRKPHRGVPVSILGKTAYFPTGAFIMSLRTGAPIVPVWWHWEDKCYHIRFSEPIEPSRGDGKIRDKAEEGMKQWTCQMDAFIRKHPDMWWNWLDKRWTNILRDGSRTE